MSRISTTNVLFESEEKRRLQSSNAVPVNGLYDGTNRSPFRSLFLMLTFSRLSLDNSGNPVVSRIKMSTPAKVPELRGNVLNRTVHGIKRHHIVKWYVRDSRDTRMTMHSMENTRAGCV